MKKSFLKNPWFYLITILSIFTTFIFYNLGKPETTCVDEFYYAPAGQAIFGNSQEPNVEHHPPLAKYFIGLGIYAFGDNGIGWRVAPYFIGLLGLIGIFLLSQQLIRSESKEKKSLVFIIAPFLLCLDFLYFALSRLAMLDIFVTTFTIFTVYFLWKAFKDSNYANLILTGLFLGLAVSSKWTAVLLLPIFLFLIFEQKEK